MARSAFVVVLAGLGFAGRTTGEVTPFQTQSLGVIGSQAQRSREDFFYRYSTDVAAIFAYGLILGLVLLIARGTRRRETFALYRPASWPRMLGLVLAALGVTYLLVVIVGLILGSGSHPDQGIPTFWGPPRAPQFAFSFAAVAVLAPFVEELTFRGLGFRLLSRFGPGAAIAGTAVLFGLVHGFLLALPVFVIIGLTLGWLRNRTGSIYSGMVFHGCFNAAAVILSISFG